MLWLVGLNFAVLLGPIAGLANTIPYLGGLLTFFLATIVAIWQFGFSTSLAWHMLWLLIGLGIVQVIDGFILQPKVIGENAGLHPLVIMLALVIAGSLFGILGMVLAVPITVILKVLTSELYHELYDRV